MKIFVRANVFFPTISETFKEMWPTLSCAHQLRCGANALVDSRYIAILDLLCNNAMGFGLLAQIGVLLPARYMSMNGVKIILADKNNWEILQRGEIQALMENPLLSCSVTEKTNHDVFPFLQLNGVSVSNRIRNSRSDNGRRSNHPMSAVHSVHRSTLPLRRPRHF